LLQLAVLTFQRLHLLRHLGCDAAALAGINLDLLAIRSVFVDLSRFSAAPRARLSHLSFESDRAFPAQC